MKDHVAAEIIGRSDLTPAESPPPTPPTSPPAVTDIDEEAEEEKCIVIEASKEAEEVADVVEHGKHFFEGVEKLLEVWFTNRDGVVDNNCNLRKIPLYVRADLDYATV